MLNLIHKRNSNKGNTEICVAHHNGKNQNVLYYTVLLKIETNSYILVQSL